MCCKSLDLWPAVINAAWTALVKGSVFSDWGFKSRFFFFFLKEMYPCFGWKGDKLMIVFVFAAYFLLFWVQISFPKLADVTCMSQVMELSFSARCVRALPVFFQILKWQHTNTHKQSLSSFFFFDLFNLERDPGLDELARCCRQTQDATTLSAVQRLHVSKGNFILCVRLSSSLGPSRVSKGKHPERVRFGETLLFFCPVWWRRCVRATCEAVVSLWTMWKKRLDADEGGRCCVAATSPTSLLPSL